MDGLGLIGRILEHFENVKEQSGGQWSARCPVHDDQTNSLCISVGDDGKALFDCKAGCATEDVISAVGLTWGDCFPQNGQSNGHASNGRIITPPGSLMLLSEPETPRSPSPGSIKSTCENCEHVRIRIILEAKAVEVLN